MERKQHVFSESAQFTSLSRVFLSAALKKSVPAAQERAGLQIEEL
jgi:hypothetical protein